LPIQGEKYSPDIQDSNNALVLLSGSRFGSQPGLLSRLCTAFLDHILYTLARALTFALLVLLEPFVPSLALILFAILEQSLQFVANLAADARLPTPDIRQSLFLLLLAIALVFLPGSFSWALPVLWGWFSPIFSRLAPQN